MKNAILLVLISSWTPISAFADSGMSPIWYYENSKGRYKAVMSQKAENDSQNGVTQGPVGSKLHIYKETKRGFPEKATFVTKARCESKSEPPEFLSCDVSSGPFSGARYDMVELYLKEERGYKKEMGDSADKDIVDAGKKLIRAFEKFGEGELPYGIFTYSILRCVSGCDGVQTPHRMIEVNPMGH